MFATLLIVMTASAAPSIQPDDNVVRCVRESVTGSLAKTRRVCHTVGEWRKIRSDMNDEARRNIVSGTLNAANNDPSGDTNTNSLGLAPGQTPH